MNKEDYEQSVLIGFYEHGVKNERARIKHLFEQEVLRTSKWQQWNRFNSTGSEWNGGNDTDTNYVIAMASHLLSILDDENNE